MGSRIEIVARHLAEILKKECWPTAPLSVEAGKLIAGLIQTVDDAADDDVTRAYRAAAKDWWNREGEIEVDDDAIVSVSSDGGAYVGAWVWVSEDQADLEGDEE
jgi:hypothetical protein